MFFVSIESHTRRNASTQDKKASAVGVKLWQRCKKALYRVKAQRVAQGYKLKASAHKRTQRQPLALENSTPSVFKALAQGIAQTNSINYLKYSLLIDWRNVLPVALQCAPKESKQATPAVRRLGVILALIFGLAGTCTSARNKRPNISP